MENITKGVFIGLIIGLVLGACAGYMLHNQIGSNFMKRGNFQLDEKTKTEITSFFDNNPSETEIDSYCSQNRMYCSYYCSQINSEIAFCDNILNESQNGPGVPISGDQR